MKEKNRIGICDPIPMFRSGIRAVLTDAAFVVDEPDDIVDWADRNGSSSVVLSLSDDTQWGLLDGLRSVKSVKTEEVSVVALLDDARPATYFDALRSGADAALPRQAPGFQLVNVVRAAIDRQVLLPSLVVRALADGVSHHDDSTPSCWTDEELGWLRELAEGTSIDDLAWRSSYSRRTMFRRLQAIYRRLGAARRDQALVEATRQGLV